MFLPKIEVSAALTHQGKIIMLPKLKTLLCPTIYIYIYNIYHLLIGQATYVAFVAAFQFKLSIKKMLSPFTSDLYPNICLFFSQSDLVNLDQRIPFYVIGDSVYPLKSWLIKPHMYSSKE